MASSLGLCSPDDADLIKVFYKHFLQPELLNVYVIDFSSKMQLA